MFADTGVEVRAVQPPTLVCDFSVGDCAFPSRSSGNVARADGVQPCAHVQGPSWMCRVSHSQYRAGNHSCSWFRSRQPTKQLLMLSSKLRTRTGFHEKASTASELSCSLTSSLFTVCSAAERSWDNCAPFCSHRWTSVTCHQWCAGAHRRCGPGSLAIIIPGAWRRQISQCLVAVSQRIAPGRRPGDRRLGHAPAAGRARQRR